MIRRQLLGDFQSCDGKSVKTDTVKDKQRQYCDLWSGIGNVQLEDNKQDKGTAQRDHCIRGILEGRFIMPRGILPEVKLQAVKDYISGNGSYYHTPANLE